MANRKATGTDRGGRTAIPRRDFLTLLGAGAAGLVLGCQPSTRATPASGAAPLAGVGSALPVAAGRRPNIIVIVADDLGYADVGFHGCRDIPTPNIDSLARGGTRFTSGYVSCPVCSPTRAGIMTGRYQQRFGHEFNPGPQMNGGLSEEFGLSLDEATLPQLLKAAGYATGMVGKWHLGAGPKHHPLQRGFQEYFGFLGGAHPYLNLRPDGARSVFRGTEPVDEKEYLTDAFAREAVAFIDRHRQASFFLYLTFNAVHTPLQAIAKYLERFPKIEDVRRRTYAAMLSAMDDAIGAVTAKVREAGLDEDTLLFFFSDNGGPPLANASRNDPLRGAKGTTFEGGIRVPFVIQWKGRVPAGKVYGQPVISLDVLPTSLAAAGAKPPEGRLIDGVDLLPYLAGGKKGTPHETLYWRFGKQKAIRRGNLKLHVNGEAQELYDLVTDIGESKNLAASEPVRLKELQDALAKWESELAEPRWGQPARGAANPQRPRARRAAGGAKP